MVKFTLLICLTLVAYGKSLPIKIISCDEFRQINYDTELITDFYIAVNAGFKEAVKIYDEVLSEEMKDLVDKLGKPVLEVFLSVPLINRTSPAEEITKKKEKYRSLAQIIETTSLDIKAIRTDLINKYDTLLNNLWEINIYNYELFVLPYYRAVFEQLMDENLTQSEQKFFIKLIDDLKLQWGKAIDDYDDIWEYLNYLMKNHFNQISELKDKLIIIYRKIKYENSMLKKN